jgi:cytosine/uracil/thiamine/allantoin permease
VRQYIKPYYDRPFIAAFFSAFAFFILEVISSISLLAVSPPSNTSRLFLSSLTYETGENFCSFISTKLKTFHQTKELPNLNTMFLAALIFDFICSRLNNDTG